MQLSYIRSVAVTKECGDWSSDLANTSSNEPYPNFGCAMQNNIAAMAVNPDDFVVPRHDDTGTCCHADAWSYGHNDHAAGASSVATGSAVNYRILFLRHANATF